MHHLTLKLHVQEAAKQYLTAESRMVEASVLEEAKVFCPISLHAARHPQPPEPSPPKASLKHATGGLTLMLHVQEAAKQYLTADSRMVEASVLEEARVYLEYANSSYYVTTPSKDDGSDEDGGGCCCCCCCLPCRCWKRRWAAVCVQPAESWPSVLGELREQLACHAQQKRGQQRGWQQQCRCYKRR